MFNEKAFRAKLILSSKKIQDIAKDLDLNPVTLYRKMKGESDFYRSEIQKLKEILNLSQQEIEEIFFKEKIT